jgi:sucrose-6-phosphate hydrolase SacC (GH32 family)
MRYRPPGMCLNDFALLECSDGWRVMHLQGPAVHPFDEASMETSYGLARSPDLVRWETMAPAFAVGPAGSFDDSAVWTMSHLRVGSGLAMFYTGVRRQPRAWQSIGLAMSDRDDGTSWSRIGSGPVAEVDQRWYRTDQHMAWRDPYVIEDAARPGSWIMALCARTVAGPVETSGCIGLATSGDLEHWTIGPPLLAPGTTSELECPVLERIGQEWLLLGSDSRRRCFDAWRAPTPTGPWKYLGQAGPQGAYAPRIVHTAEGPLVLHTQRRRFGGTDDGPLVRGCLSQPKLLSFTETGRPYLGWWRGMDKFLHARDDQIVVDGMAMYHFREPSHAVMQLGNSPGALRVTLSGRSITLGYANGAVLQSAPLAEPARRSVRILRYQEFIEVYIDDRLSLVHLAYNPPEPAAVGSADGKPIDATCFDLQI